jgi:enamine deaminase RidA (YjgF/YER057c/UK114 family)
MLIAALMGRPAAVHYTIGTQAARGRAGHHIMPSCMQEDPGVKKEIISPTTVAKPAAPYASAIKVSGMGSLVFVAGVVSSDLSGRIIHKGDILEQTRQTVRNLIATLEAAGVPPQNVVKTTTYVLNSAMPDFFKTQAFLEALTPFKTTDTLVGVAGLAGSDLGQLIEIDAIAVAEA